MNARLLRRGMGWWPPFLGAVVAKVRKTLYFRLKPKHRPA